MTYDPTYTSRDGIVLSAGVQAAQSLEQGDALALNRMDGMVELASALQAYRRWAGIAGEFGDNSGGIDGAVEIEYRGAPHVFGNRTIIGSGGSGVLQNADIGRIVYAYGAESFSVLPGTGGVPCGRLTRIIDAGTSSDGRGDIRSFAFGEEPIWPAENWYIMNENWQQYVSADTWTLLAPDSGTATLQDVAGGAQIDLKPSDGTVVADDEIALYTTKKHFKFAASQPAFWECEIKVTEANTDETGVFIGVTDTTTMLADSTLLPVSNYTGAGFFKPHSSLFFRYGCSVTTTPDHTTSSTAWASGTWYTLGLEWVPGATTGTLYFYVNKALLGSKSFAVASATSAYFLFAAKNEANTNNNTLSCRRFYARQVYNNA